MAVTFRSLLLLRGPRRYLSLCVSLIDQLELQKIATHSRPGAMFTAVYDVRHDAMKCHVEY